jgi:hypothetical protein
MSNRTLAHTRDDGATGEGWYSELRIERSAAGQPSLLFIVEDYENGTAQGSAAVVVKDGNATLAPVLQWLNQATATIGSDRHDAARAALAEWDRPTGDVIGEDGFPIVGTVELASWVIKTLRTALELPATRSPR